MSNNPLRVAAIHDLSGFGRCSLSVILPVLSSMGVQAVAVPTAVLSSHTGGLGDVVFRDLTDYISPCLAHYKKIGVDFDCVYSGFLGSQEQIDHCLEFFRSYPGALAVVDPVMGDHGKAYRTCTADIRRRMAELISIADIITPNLTEGYILLNQDYSDQCLSRTDARKMLVKLSEKGPKYVVVTGVPMMTGEMANIGYDRSKNAFWIVKCNYVPVSYPGTGDIYASVLTGSMLCGDSLPIAMERATHFVEAAIKITFSYATDTRYGVMLEKVLPMLSVRETLTGYEVL